MHAAPNKRGGGADADVKASNAARALRCAALAALIWAGAGAGCAGGGGGEVIVFAAASLTDALTGLGADYEAETGERVGFSFGGSQHLARQIADGAPADLLIPAGRQPTELLERASKIEGEPIDLLGNELVVVARRGIERPPADLAELARLPGTSVSIPDPGLAPAGRYARDALTSLGLWDALSAAAVPTADVRAALTNVERGNTDFAIVYRTDAASGDGLIVLDIVPDGSHPQIVYPVVVVAGSDRAAAARRFAEFLAGARAMEVFGRYGFPPAPSGPPAAGNGS